jgi:RHS repeat-associated protein
MISRAAAAEKRTATFTHDNVMESFRNPQFSTATTNRFLFSNSPGALVGGGDSGFVNPALRGLDELSEPTSLWLPFKGKIEWEARDLYMKGVGLDLSFERIWRGSVSAFDGPLGQRWEFTWNKRLFEPDATSNVTLYDAGRNETYTYSAGTFTSPAGRYDSLARLTTPNPDEYSRTDRTGMKETYEYDTNSGTSVTWYRLKEVRDLNDNTLTFAYDGSRNLTKATDTLSRDTTLSYDGNDRITKIADSAGREWIYGYDGGGLLTSVRTPTVDEAGSDDDYTSGKTTTYKYDSGNKLTEVVRPGDGATGKWKWAYDGAFVTKETRSGNDINLTHDTTNHFVTVADREGVTTRYAYEAANFLVTSRRIYSSFPSTYWETTWAYDANNEVTAAIFPKGNRILYSYDGSGNILTVDFKKDADDASPVRWVYTYASNTRLSTLKDPNGNVWDFDWDSKGNLTRKAAPAVTIPGDIETTDNNGNGVYDGTIVETWEYNSSGLVTRHSDAVGTDTDTAYTTVNGRAAYAQYEIADAGGLNLTTAYAYDSKGNMTSMTDPEGHNTTYTVNALSQTIMAVEPGSVTHKWHFDPNDRVTKSEDSNDTTIGDSWYVVDAQFDVQDNQTKAIADVDDTATRLTTAYVFDKNDRLTKVTSPAGNDTEYRYEQRDLRTSTIRKAASAPDDAITSVAYDANGNVTATTDPRGNVSTEDRDGYDRVTTRTTPLGHYVSYAFDKNGNVTQQTWKNVGATTLAQATFYFDEANRLYQTDRLAKKADLSTSLGDGMQSETGWRDERGSVVEYSGDVCGCSSSTHSYDAIGRQVTTTDPMADSDLVIMAYDKDGNITKTTVHDETQDAGIEADKDIVTEFVLDARHNVVSRKEKLTSSPTYATTLYSYGLRDQVTKVIDPESNEIRIEHNEQLWKTKDTTENGASDVITSYTFDADGRMVTYTATNSTTGDQSTIYTYDKLDRVVTTTWPDAGTHLYTYDKTSNRISTTDPNTALTVNAFDANNRLTSQTITLASNVIGATSRTFAYDGMDRRTAADTSEGGAFTTSLVWTYNSLSKPQTEKQVIDGYASGAGRTITWDWDVDGQKTGVTYPVSASVVTYDRDALDRADKITRDGTQVVDYAFNGRRVIRKAMPGSEALYTYDGYGRLTQIHHKDTGSGNTLAKFVYAYDKSHQVSSQDKYFYDDVQNTRITTDTVDKGDQYDYDGAKRLVTTLRGVPTAYIDDPIANNISLTRYDDLVEYQLDQSGNRLTRKIDGAVSRRYTHSTTNQVATEDGVSQTFKANGTYSGAGATTYKYDVDDRFAWYDAGARQFTWHYDAIGRQVARTKAGSGGVSDIHIYYDGLNDVEVCTWISSNEALSRRMVYGERINELLEHTDATPNPDVVFYAHPDKLDSVMLLALADGSIQESYRYSDYGEPTVVDSGFSKQANLTSSIGNQKRYTGQEHALPSSVSDPWYHYRARAYRADAGRFVQRDPIRNSDPNLYAYVQNKPLDMTDPTGRLGFSISGRCQYYFNMDKPTSQGGAVEGTTCGPLIVGPGPNTLPGLPASVPGKCGNYHVDVHMWSDTCQPMSEMTQSLLDGWSISWGDKPALAGGYYGNNPGGLYLGIDKLRQGVRSFSTPPPVIPQNGLPYYSNLSDSQTLFRWHFGLIGGDSIQLISRWHSDHTPPFSELVVFHRMTCGCNPFALP